MPRPEKLPMPAQLVVWASTELTMAEKVAWYHHWFLDQGGADGCYAQPKSMAARMGMSARTVEDCRTRLKRLGLLVQWRRTEGHERFAWRAAIPAVSSVPRTFAEASDLVPALVLVLDHHIRVANAWDAGDAPPPSPDLMPWTYFIQAGGKNGDIKIGAANDPDGRRDSLQTGHSDRLRIIGRTKAVTERAAQKRWAGDRLRGEWFRSSEEFLLWIKEVCQPVTERGANLASPRQAPGSEATTTPVGDVPIAGGASREGGRGEGASSVSQPERQLLPASQDAEVQRKQEEGAFARANDRRGSMTHIRALLPRDQVA